MKKRLDILLTDRNLVESRSRAKAVIMEGAVFVDGVREDKPGTMINPDANIELKTNPIPFVSRGGLKIQKALKEFGIDIAKKTVMDIGASTGGFTDCMLQNGAAYVYAVDVGYGQLDYRLRTDDRVCVMERTNIRNVTGDDLEKIPSFASIDVSFISLTIVLPVVKSLLERNHEIVALIKPQFEAGKEEVGKNGVIRDIKIHEKVIEKVYDFSLDLGYSVCGLSFSPIKGPKGNIEYLIDLKTDTDKILVQKDNIKEVTSKAHAFFKGDLL